MGIRDTTEGSPKSPKTKGTKKKIAIIIGGKLHQREGRTICDVTSDATTMNDTKNVGGGGAIEKPDAGCISEEVVGRVKSVAAVIESIRRRGRRR